MSSPQFYPSSTINTPTETSSSNTPTGNQSPKKIEDFNEKSPQALAKLISEQSQEVFEKMKNINQLLEQWQVTASPSEIKKEERDSRFQQKPRIASASDPYKAPVYGRGFDELNYII
jgi:hypothetical protein